MGDYYQTTRDILHAIERLHRQLARHYRQLGHGTSQERLRLLLDYMSTHEEKLQMAMRRTGHDSSEAVLNTWFRDAPALDEVMAELSPRAADSQEQLISQAQALGRHLLTLYEQLAETAPTQKVRALFENIALQARQEEARLQMAALQLQDI